MKKIFPIIMAVAMTISLLIPSNVKAQTIKNEGVEINLGEINLFIPDYKKNDVNVQTIEKSATDISVNIVDKKTGIVLETITCTSIPKNSRKLDSIITQDSIESQDTFYYAIQSDKFDGLVTVRLETVVVLYKSGSFSYVESIAGCNMFPISSSNSTLESVLTYARSVSGSFPSTNIEFYGSGVITIATTKTIGDELSIGLSIPEVANLGYTVNTGSAGTIYLRKTVAIQGNFYTYSQGY